MSLSYEINVTGSGATLRPPPGTPGFPIRSRLAQSPGTLPRGHLVCLFDIAHITHRRPQRAIECFERPRILAVSEREVRGTRAIAATLVAVNIPRLLAANVSSRAGLSEIVKMALRPSALKGNRYRYACPSGRTMQSSLYIRSTDALAPFPPRARRQR